MKKRNLVVILSALLLMGLAVFAQSQPSLKAKAPSGTTTTCPMMGMMENRTSGKPAGMMKEMQQRMAGMFSLSGEEIAARLTAKKAELSLSDAQVKQVADLIASSEQEKIKEAGVRAGRAVAQTKSPGQGTRPTTGIHEVTL